MTPTRIQRLRAKGAKQPANTKYCGRPSAWGNPFVVNKLEANYYRISVNTNRGGFFRNKCIDVLFSYGRTAGFSTKQESQAHAAYLFGRLLDLFPYDYDVRELAGYAHLSCFCAPGEPCHVDKIIEKINHEGN